jgi:hypothetical protein
MGAAKRDTHQFQSKVAMGFASRLGKNPNSCPVSSLYLSLQACSRQQQLSLQRHCARSEPIQESFRGDSLESSLRLQ